MKKTILLASLCTSLFLIGCGNKKTPKTEEPKKDTTAVNEEVKDEKPMTGSLTIVNTVVEPGEEINVDFKAEGTIGKNAWVGLIPSNIEHGNESKNDEYDLSYQYLGDKTSGTMSFVAPADTGKFDFRLNSTDNNGVEVSSVTFTVKGTPNTKSEITLDKKSYAKGEKMVISFRAPLSWDGNAWIGVVPSATKHGKADDADAVDVGYVYIKKRSKGVWNFTAPGEAGKYNVRMFDAENGKEVKSVDFTVE